MSDLQVNKQTTSLKELKSIVKLRQNNFNTVDIKPVDIDAHIALGYLIDRKFKSFVRMKKQKPAGDKFIDDSWIVFAGLGFEMNRVRKYEIQYDENFPPLYVDIVASDKETIIIGICVSNDNGIVESNFYEVVKPIIEDKDKILKSIKKEFNNSNQKIKFIVVSRGYYLSNKDKEILERFDILHFDEDILSYYQELSKHLGISARFQLLGNLFEGQTILGLDNKIPAIQGKMGGHTYYSFSIEPDKLLKIGFVLHRNKANKKLMPTYQRIIKKARLKGVQAFVEEGGFFPNSLVVNLNNNGRKLRFDQNANQVDESISKIGILHLPKSYRSAYIIDGQHRLYGYANSEYKDKNTIPVVAFVDLDRKDQVKLFMQINENQKSVPKNLRNTLNSDLLWESDDVNEQVRALKLQIALDMGEEKQSPLYDKIIVGENSKSLVRCITIDTIKNGLDRSNFFGTFSKNSRKPGTLYRGNNDSTYDLLYPFLIKCFAYIKQGLPNEWSKGEEGNGFLSINAGVESLLRIFSDIVDHLVVKADMVTSEIESHELFIKVEPYLQSLVMHLGNITNEEKISLRKSYGTGGRAKYWRMLQKLIKENHLDFIPSGYDSYWADEAKRFNTHSIEMIRDIEMFFKTDFQERLIRAYGNDFWFDKGVPATVQEPAVLLAQKKNREIDDPKDRKVAWDCINIIDYRRIALHGSNWRDIFEKHYTEPSNTKKSGNKDDKTSWMQKLERIRNQNFHEYSVKEDEYTFLLGIHQWLMQE